MLPKSTISPLPRVLFALLICCLHNLQKSTVMAQQQAAAPSATSTDDQVDGQESKAANPAVDEAEAQDSPDADEVVVKGHFLAKSEHPIASRPEEWAEDLRVEFCVPHGTRVKQGDVLVRLRSRKLEHAIEDQQQSVVAAQLAARKGHEELEHLRKSTRMTVSDARRAERRATEDLKRFVTVVRDQRQESLEFSLKSAEDYLAYEEEELKQLVKMYEADDLTEETEEIVLRRTRDDVERSRYRLTLARQSLEKGLEVDVPRSQEELEDALKKTTLALQRALTVAETDVAEKEANVEQLDRALHRAEQRLSRLTADQRCMTLTAPISGLVYLGEQQFGQWSNSGPLSARLQPGTNIKPQQVLMTVVEPAVGRIVAIVPEADLQHLAVNQSGKLVVPAFSDLACDAKVIEISSIPIDDGKFLVTLQPALPPNTEQLVPGMTCQVIFEKSK